eukprot:5935631-Prymnesium_polylepis.1
MQMVGVRLGGDLSRDGRAEAREDWSDSWYGYGILAPWLCGVRAHLCSATHEQSNTNSRHL